MNFKAIAIAAAAAAAATSVQAADLPADIAPVDYVRINDAYGAGFFVLPGTETAIKIGGRIRVEARFTDLLDDEDYSREDNNHNFRSRANLRIDTRTQSELGLIRTYMDFQYTSNSDSRDAEGVKLDKGYVQIGGFTFGLATSAFDLWTGELASNLFDRHLADDTVWQASYTHALGNGLTIAASIEDNADREQGVDIGTDDLNKAGNTLPSFVAKVLLNQGWGYAGLSGAVTKVDTSVGRDSSEVGYAVAGAVGFNLDMIAPGDVINFQAAYADGAMAYVGAEGDVADAVLDADGDIETNKAWSVAGGYMHNWTSELSSGVEASYLDVEAGAGDADFNQVVVAGTLEYRPVSGLLFSAGAGWKQDDVDGASKEDAGVLNFRVQRSF
ncbi:Porin subfamily protein [Pseudovibrio ascidiaceicola]|uniref:Porin n=1 Tax=Pseudovibrio ascidiaceicola TaxID=285279 RepID=A0A1I4BLU5_9HYPH|nr:porin [Pseudovibrio ascidiaceicola]SFK69695.1 Porin subfamily protein [Pseudovibrio ascidiaceicola]